MCRKLMKEICLLSKETDKQVRITTHNPAYWWINLMMMSSDYLRCSGMKMVILELEGLRFKPQASA